MKNKVKINTGLSRKGAQCAERKQRQLFTCIMWIVAICFMLYALAEPAMGAGLTLASLSVIGSLDDVSDRDTHGNELAYQVVLIDVADIASPFTFPQPSASRVVTIGKSILKAGTKAICFTAHTIPTLVSSSEKGDVTTTGTNTFTVIMGGDRVKLKDFIEEFSGGRFIVLYKHIKSTTWHIIGEPERPMVLNNTEMKDDADGRYTTLTFVRNSVYLDCEVAFATGESIEDLLTGVPAQ